MKLRGSSRRRFVSAIVAAGLGGTLAACSTGGDPVSTQRPIDVADKTPPPISGGTLLISSHAKDTAIASDSDRDIVWVVDLEKRAPTAEIHLRADDEPGRLVEDAAGRVHVALRKGGAVVTIDPAKGTLVDRTDVCAAPRGLAYDAKLDAVHVVCMNGELVTLPAAGGKPLRKIQLERDLRDVVVQGDDLVISTFRTAQLLLVGADGVVKVRTGPPEVQTRKIRLTGITERFTPTVAWRTIAGPFGGAVMVHQRALDTSVVARSGTEYYGGDGTSGCDKTIVHTTVTEVSTDVDSLPPTAGAPAIPDALLPVDIATHVDKSGVVLYSIAAAASNSIVTVPRVALAEGTQEEAVCTHGDDVRSTPVAGEPVALAYRGDDIVVQTRDPIALTVLGGQPIILPGASTTDTGHDMFHRNDRGTVALVCASCHPEGRDDGHVWKLNVGARKTPMVSNDVLTTAPFHWDGKMLDMGMIMVNVFEKKMGGVHMGPEHVSAIEGWLSALPHVPNPLQGDPASVDRGREIFQRADVGCTGCHNGAKLTNNKNEDVGTGKAFQVPSLVGAALRPPYMHDGCALTLRDRFDPECGGTNHGHTDQLSEADLDDLTAYLESL